MLRRIWRYEVWTDSPRGAHVVTRTRKEATAIRIAENRRTLVRNLAAVYLPHIPKRERDLIADSMYWVHDRSND